MLVLSRKRDEAIIIGNDIKITVIDVKGNVVKLGIEAPGCYRILRGEIREDGQVDLSESDEN